MISPRTTETTFSADDEKWMGLALERGGGGTPSPNPHVGALVVQRGAVVGAGHHERAGEDHAEVLALREAGEHARGATLFVTLEPCNHVGRTPPCTNAILASKVARVVIGCRDPNPHVAGGGVEKLQDAGLRVDVGCREADAQRLIAPWTKFVTMGVPYVTLKLALSLDGRIAARTGASKWVTGQQARARVHLLRAQHDAVVVGIGTALADDPQLTVREAPGQSPPASCSTRSYGCPLPGSSCRLRARCRRGSSAPPTRPPPSSKSWSNEAWRCCGHPRQPRAGSIRSRR